MSPTDPLLALLPIAIVLRRGEDLAPNPSACTLVGRPAGALTTLSAWFDTLFGATAASAAPSRKLCRKMGGDGTVTSQLGVGSVFEVRLPLR
jgi:hypothetical protein